MSPHSQLPVITFTGNPLAETTFCYARWTPGKTQRATGGTFQTGGKGINVSKMLLRLGCATQAMTFLGGHSGRNCQDWMQARGIPCEAIPVAKPTRTGLVVRAPQTPETSFLGPDSPPSAEEWACAATKILDLNDGNCAALAFCGSAPGFETAAAACFREALQALIAQGVPVYVDTYGPALSWFCQQPVSLIKINADEFRGFCQAPNLVLNETSLLSRTQETMPQTWVVSDGAGTVYWAAPKAQEAGHAQPPQIQEISATGSGDVMLACLLHARLNLKSTWSQALAFSLPLAAANAAHEGIAEFPMP
jgi:1-phosphofructokinase